MAKETATERIEAAINRAKVRNVYPSFTANFTAMIIGRTLASEMAAEFTGRPMNLSPNQIADLFETAEKEAA